MSIYHHVVQVFRQECKSRSPLGRATGDSGLRTSRTVLLVPVAPWPRVVDVVVEARAITSQAE
eukprot:scaffold359379_cov39-Prasinocladus_malaysianus.AAC.1